MWTKHRYGGPHMDGHWTLTDGTLQFDVHPLYLCSPKQSRHIVNDDEANRYAQAILDSLNANEVAI
jgi:hypothetical protein